jgi:hypothetical protein
MGANHFAPTGDGRDRSFSNTGMGLGIRCSPLRWPANSGMTSRCRACAARVEDDLILYPGEKRYVGLVLVGFGYWGVVHWPTLLFLLLFFFFYIICFLFC